MQTCPPDDQIKIALFAPLGLSTLSLGLISEPFLLANQVLGFDKYQLSLLESEQVFAQPYFERESFADAKEHELLIIAADVYPDQQVSTHIKKALQHYVRQQSGNILTVQAGLYWLLESGLGLQQPWVVHWSLLDNFKDHFPEVTFNHHLYHASGRLQSCAGQLACLDYLVEFLGRFEQQGLLNQIMDLLCLDRLRSSDEKQRLPTQAFAGEEVQPRLTMAIELMEKHIEEPLSCEDIAQKVSISKRQLERLFKRHLNTMPLRYYLQVRLKRAQHLLLHSNMSIVQIGLSCGFSSGPHFSSSYKSFYHTTPREERSKSVAKRTIK